jgi:hypothetical protein
MTSSASLPSSSSTHHRRRLCAIALLSLTLFGAAAPAALADPDTNIQKPGHVLNA